MIDKRRVELLLNSEPDEYDGADSFVSAIAYNEMLENVAGSSVAGKQATFDLYGRIGRNIDSEVRTNGGLRITVAASIANGLDGNGITIESVLTESGGPANGARYNASLKRLTIYARLNVRTTFIRGRVNSVSGFNSVTFGTHSNSDGVGFTNGPKHFSGGLNKFYQLERGKLFRINLENDAWIYYGNSAPANDDFSRYIHAGTTVGILPYGEELYVKSTHSTERAGSIESWILDKERGFFEG